MTPPNPASPAPDEYQALIAAEGQVWGRAAREAAAQDAPDWRAIRHTPHYAVLDGPYIEWLLGLVQPGWRVLEIGCSSGWLALEMARRGAHVEGLDVAEEAIRIAESYAAAHPPTPGSVRYAVADINHLDLPTESYDLVVALGVLHHLTEVEAVLSRIRAALRPGGLLFVGDPFETPKINALIAGALTFVLPTHMRYGEKFRHVLRLRGKVLSRVADSIEAKGLSPFEGYGRHEDPLTLISRYFTLREVRTMGAFTGYVIAQLALPRAGIIRVGRLLNVIDRACVRLGLLKALSYKLLAEKK